MPGVSGHPDLAGSATPECTNSISRKQGAPKQPDLVTTAVHVALASMGCLAVKLFRIAKKKEEVILITQHALVSTKDELDHARKQLDATNEALKAAKTVLDATRGELGSSRSQIQIMENEIRVTERQLRSTQAELQRTVQQLRSKQSDDMWELSP